MEKSNYNVMIGPPGPNFGWGCVQGLLALTGSRHNVQLTNSRNGFDDFNAIWATALNAAEDGKITHFAMLHLDISPMTEPQDGVWLDTLIEELDRLDLDLVSAISPLKDARGLTSSGIGDPTNSWEPYRRIAIRELPSLPATFDAATLGYPNRPLLHNTGCWACDLRKPIFHQTNENGENPLHFGFPEKIYRDPHSGQWRHARESEDWFFSRRLWEHKAKTAITKKVRLNHMGSAGFSNWGVWGQMEHDDATAHKWAVPRGPWDKIQGWFDFADLYQEQVNRIQNDSAHFVEVGSWLGKSATFMATKIRESGKAIKFDCIDNWEGCPASETYSNGLANREWIAKSGRDLYAEFCDNIKICGVEQNIKPIRGDSAQSASLYSDQSLDFVFIDADHSQEAVARDLAAWWPKVKTTGVLAGHDYDEVGVRNAVDEFASLHNLKTIVRCRSFVLQSAG